ncbi:hypothetical protein EYB25_010068 [Talaromyces marneffei]|nr:hypothetical protein EYB25_010068 [Talaromyces marneffei]
MMEPNTQSTPVTLHRKQYLALSFAPAKSTNGGETQWDFDDQNQKVTKVTEEQPENTPSKPFEIPAGKYFLSLKLINDVPTNDGLYLHKMWHMESESGPRRVEDGQVAKIRAVGKFEGDLGEYEPTYAVRPTKTKVVRLGEIKLSLGLREYELVGDIHFCFKRGSEGGWPSIFPFKKPSANLKYHILVN